MTPRHRRTGMVMVLRILLAAVVSACGLVLLAPPPPAAACSCVGGTPATYVDWADAVFVGTLTGPPHDDNKGPELSSVDPLVYTFDVETVFEGDVAATAQVESARFGASCGLEGLQVGKRYLMFAESGRAAGTLTAGLCGGSQLARANLIQKVEAVTGPGQAPTAAQPPATTPTASVTDDDVGAPTSSPAVGYALVGFAAVILAGITWVLMPRRRRATSPPLS